jgi:hypothetical protein
MPGRQVRGRARPWPTENSRCLSDQTKPSTADRGQLNERQIADFVAWIKSGVPDPRTAGVELKSKVRTRALGIRPSSTPWFQPKERALIQTLIDALILANSKNSPPVAARRPARHPAATYDGLSPAYS